MGIQSYKANKRKLKVVKYYLLQNKIMNNLLGRETIENEHKIEKGYLANPESLKIAWEHNHHNNFLPGGVLYYRCAGRYCR